MTRVLKTDINPGFFVQPLSDNLDRGGENNGLACHVRSLYFFEWVELIVASKKDNTDLQSSILLGTMFVLGLKTAFFVVILYVS